MTGKPNKKGKKMENVAFFQVLSRNNDRNGNPYRLIVVYSGNKDGFEIAYIGEARDTYADHLVFLRQQKFPEIPSIHLTPGEYNKFKRNHKSLLQDVS